MMTDELELHDSSVELSMAGGALVLQFRPAYIHHWEMTDAGWIGEGRNQDIDLVVGEGSFDSPMMAGQFLLSGGEIKEGDDLLDNMIPVPIERSGVVRGRLESIYGDVVTFAGRGLSTRFIGPAEFVEKLRAECAPDGGAA